VPLLLKLADLEQLLVGAAQPRRDDCSFLLDLLVQLWDAQRYGVGRDDWQQLLKTDRGILLLDGLDEVADEVLRQRLLQVFRDACTHWQCPIVVTSRPISTEALADLGFQPATVEPFSPDEIRAFIDRWVAALQDVAEVSELGRAGASYRQALQEAIAGNPGVRRMANNPVLLTCLCVVHWNEGKRLPEGRAQVFSAALRWLLAARSSQRRTLFSERAADALSENFALRALAALALAMLASEGGKQTRTDLEAAVDAVVPELAREFPQFEALSLRHRARAWLEFECLGSGVIVKVAGNRIAFWHLNFQEYLAALQLAWLSDGDCDDVGDRGAKAWWPQILPRLEDLQWRETIELFPACLLAGGQGRIDLLLDRALARRGSKPDLADDARVVGVLGRWLPSLAVYGYKPPADWAQTYEEVRQQTSQIFELGGAELPFALRLSAAEAASSIGQYSPWRPVQPRSTGACRAASSANATTPR
jgi:predicted NACHT family NTPase